jgi:predicted AAA+ superfamily ATPase
MSEGRGAVLETVVYLHLRRRQLAPQYYLTQEGREVDFVLSGESRAERRLIQVCWSLEDKPTREREMASLTAARRELGVKDATVVTWLDEGGSEKGVEVVPLWKWLLAEAS